MRRLTHSATQAALCALFMLASPALSADGELRREGHVLYPPEPVSFKADSAELTPESAKDLALIKAYLDKTRFISTLRIEGHVTSGKDEATRIKLSQQRAVTVTRWLVSKGIDCKRLIAVGFGSSKPIVEAGEPGNERIEFVHAALNGHAIGGLPLDGGGAVAATGCE